MYLINFIYGTSHPFHIPSASISGLMMVCYLTVGIWMNV